MTTEPRSAIGEEQLRIDLRFDFPTRISSDQMEHRAEREMSSRTEIRGQILAERLEKPVRPNHEPSIGPSGDRNLVVQVKKCAAVVILQLFETRFCPDARIAPREAVEESAHTVGMEPRTNRAHIEHAVEMTQLGQPVQIEE